MTEVLRSLVGDIGGTNARFALVNPDSLVLEGIQMMSSIDYSDLEDAVRLYLKNQGVETIARACLAVAGPVVDGKVSFTNSHWKIDQQQFKQDFELEVMALINDFAAQALAVPHLPANELMSVGPELDFDPDAVKLVIGPGTGLGLCGLIETPVGWQALPGEGGNADFAPSTERDISVWRFIRKEVGGLLGVERILSGSGLELLYEAHSSLDGRMDKLQAADITVQALEDQDSLAYEVLDHFFEILGNTAGNAALVLGARGGVYIAGGIIPRVKTLFARGTFRKAFENRDKMRDYMSGIPTWLILSENPGLTGAAAYLNCSGHY
ncbi:glucokinase [Endozoicomonas sp. 8E]|uniref:glucokinase n=1 Tax=Endozoicomonas sp. 8E TaxID=3035692 RepID=UPI0029392744|nr:glucokinase [Endozoicomonas sp. 8E]WOG29107.1 glucokinase [Endozoicomonas sp. 8E]